MPHTGSIFKEQAHLTSSFTIRFHSYFRKMIFVGTVLLHSCFDNNAQMAKKAYMGACNVSILLCSWIITDRMCDCCSHTSININIALVMKLSSYMTLITYHRLFLRNKNHLIWQNFHTTPIKAVILAQNDKLETFFVRCLRSKLGPI